MTSTNQLSLDFQNGNISIKQQTGWNRPHSKMILQNIDLLLKVTQYNYDLTDPEFVLYAHSRGCMNGAGKPDKTAPDYQAYKARLAEEKEPFNGDLGQWRRWVREHGKSFDEFWASDDLLLNLAGKPISDEDRRLKWKSILIARAQLQDCWEIYQLTEMKNQILAAA